MLKSFAQFTELVTKHAEANAVAMFQEGTADLSRKVAIDTPVDTGRATANWKGGVNRNPEGSSNIFDKSPTAKKTYDILKTDIKKAKLQDTIIVRNAVNDGTEDGEFYIRKLENGPLDGGSTQAPTGMFMKNMATARKSFKKTKKRIFK